MDAKTASDRIDELELLQGLSGDARRQVADVILDVADVLEYPGGERLINEGYLSFDIGYVLLDGNVLVEREDLEPVVAPAPALLGEMAQFSASDVRSATVRAKSDVVAARFYWDDLYKEALATLPEDVHAAFREAIENQIWDRFEYPNIVDLSLFSSLQQPLRRRICLPFPLLGSRVHLEEVDTLFNEGAPCESTGYLLVSGKLRLFRNDGREKLLDPPNIVGIFPYESDKGKLWSATAMADGEAEVLKFSWDAYTSQIMKRLDREEQKAFVRSIKDNGSKHVWN